MYEFLKKIVLRLLRTPPEPHPPQGDLESLKVFRASRNYYRYRLYVWIVGRLFGAGVVALLILGAWGAAWGAANESPELQGLAMAGGAAVTMLLLFGFLAAVLFSYTTLRMDYEMRWYMVTDRSLRIREGVAHVSEMTMTFANIQNISIEQGPIQRLFKISDLKVQTAGGGGMVAHQQAATVAMHIGWFKGVDDAQAIRDLMLQRLRHYRDAGLGATDDVPSSEAEPGRGLDDPQALELLKVLGDEARRLRRSAERLT